MLLFTDIAQPAVREAAAALALEQLRRFYDLPADSLPGYEKVALASIQASREWHRSNLMCRDRVYTMFRAASAGLRVAAGMANPTPPRRTGERWARRLVIERILSVAKREKDKRELVRETFRRLGCDRVRDELIDTIVRRANRTGHHYRRGAGPYRQAVYQLVSRAVSRLALASRA